MNIVLGTRRVVGVQEGRGSSATLSVGWEGSCRLAGFVPQECLEYPPWAHGPRVMAASQLQRCGRVKTYLHPGEEGHGKF